jgi:hypothetical protein
MLVQQLVVLGNISVVKIGDSKIEENIEQEGKIEDDEIKTVIAGSNNILDRAIDAQYPKWLYQQVKKKQKN